MKKCIYFMVTVLACMSVWGDFGMFLFRDDSYADKIEAKAGLFTAEQAAQILLSKEYQEPTLTVEQIE